MTTIVEFKTGLKTKKDEYQIMAQWQLFKEGCIDIDFFEDGHIYKKDGKRIYSITQILKVIEGWNYSDKNTLPMDRGSYIHKCLELYNNKVLDTNKLDYEVTNYIFQYVLFCKEHNLTNNKVESEKIMYSKKYNYAGTIDSIFHDTPENKLILLYLKEDSYKAKVIKFTNEKFREFQSFQVTHRVKNS